MKSWAHVTHGALLLYGSLLISSYLFIFSDLPMQSLKIGSLNINGGRDRHKRASISEIAPQKRIDVLVFAGDILIQ